MNKRPGIFAAAALGIVLFTASCGAPARTTEPGGWRILITNDDGIEAPGLRALALALRQLGEVTVAAPAANQSGVSHGLTSGHPIPVRETRQDGIRWLAIGATPATCVRLAVERLLPARPDIVLSGINKGENLGTVTFYSATVAAAREAALLGLPAMAMNLAARHGLDYGPAAEATAGIIRALGPGGIAAGTFLNVNFPALARERWRGIRITRQDTRASIVGFSEAVAADGTAVYAPGWAHLEPEGPDTDIWALRNGYVSISVFGIDQSAAAPPAAVLAVKRLESLPLH